MGFTGAQQGTKFNGRFATFTAHINLDLKDPTKGSVAGTVQLDVTATRRLRRAVHARRIRERLLPAGLRARLPSWVSTAVALAAVDELVVAVHALLTASGPAGSAQFTGAMKINRFDFNVGEGWNDTSWVSQDVAVDVKLDLKQ